jgi:hypothetical protein
VLKNCCRIITTGELLFMHHWKIVLDKLSSKN